MIAGILILSGPILLYFLLLHFSDKKLRIENEVEDTFSSKYADGPPDDEFNMISDNIKWNIPEFNSAEDHRNTALGGSNVKNEPNLFNLDINTYEGKDYICHTGNINDLSKKFLEIMGKILNKSIIILFLKDADGNYRASLKRQGSINLSGEIIAETLQNNIIGLLEKNRNLLSEDKKICYVSLIGPGGFSGAVKINSEREITSPDTIKRMLVETRRFGELLYQANIFEQANTDLQSGLMNGLKFQSALEQEFRIKDLLNADRQLILAETNKSYIPSLGGIFSEVLTDNFQLFRIASGTIAILGPEMNPEQFRIFEEKIKNKIDAHPGEIYMGRSILKNNMSSPAVWLADAENNLRDNMNFPETDARALVN